jgi:hypothetical protein
LTLLESVMRASGVPADNGPAEASSKPAFSAPSAAFSGQGAALRNPIEHKASSIDATNTIHPATIPSNHGLVRNAG